MRKHLIGIVLLGFVAVNTVALPVVPAALGATAAKKVAVVGKAKFTAKGSVVSATKNSITVHVNAASKNAAAFKGTDQIIPIARSTKVTKGGKKIDPSQIPSGSRVKVFGILDKKTKTIVKISWVKVLP